MASMIDFRRLDEGLGGERARKKKRLRDEEDAAEIETAVATMDLEQPSAKRSALSIEGALKPTHYGRPTYDGIIAGKVSGRKWKQTKTSRTSSIKVSRKGVPFDERIRQKEIKRAYKERMTELKEQIRASKNAKRKQKEERARIKKENELKTGTMLQKITNPKKLNKMSKKQKKKLRVIAD